MVEKRINVSNIIYVDFVNKRVIKRRWEKEDTLEDQINIQNEAKKTKFYKALKGLDYNTIKTMLGDPPDILRVGISRDDVEPISKLIKLLRYKEGESREGLSLRRKKAYNLMILLLSAGACPEPLLNCVLPEHYDISEGLLKLAVYKKMEILGYGPSQ